MRRARSTDRVPDAEERTRGAMTELMLHERREFTERLVVFRDEEQRVIAEPGRSALRLTNDPTSTRAAGFKANRSARIGQRQGADERRAATLVGNVRQHGEHFSVVRLVVAVRTGIPRRNRRRRTVEGIDGQAGIIGQHPLIESDRRFRGLLASIPRERVGVFDDIQRGVKL